ncbi:hypothetical protein PLEOSDRAFT_23490 [Pleurotus ostreatus PC15]|uniref:RNA helicase n=1 Tax=Pleurotus ostreatus (strain PC15) TaxID=1137138 RepID=A0A067NT08_PLEO1|nr:hypothetical protein PLEOSDRAFT_23490 [Pleurotus ostreatus PC15]
MPPRKHIVKSGNAGNSSKGKEKASEPVADPNKPPPLFPPGSKFPASLLSERCQKEGWEKPQIDTVSASPKIPYHRLHFQEFQPRKNDGYSFVVTLRRVNKKSDSGMDSVRLEPHPPYICSTALEARHWGATYALYRFCNGIRLQLVLPKGPRDYWNQLASEHAQAPEHQSWMYEADPFAARKMVVERQAKVAIKNEQKVTGLQQGTGSFSAESKEFAKCPEVRMATSLRDVVESCIKKGLTMYPEVGDASAGLTDSVMSVAASQLKTLGFTGQQAKKATDFLSAPSTLASRLLAGLPPLEACIEYLVLDLPECDLPPRFLPADHSSDPFITSAHTGTDDLRQRWIKEKAMKEAGWPKHIVDEIASDKRFCQSFEVLVAALGQRLIGNNVEDLIVESKATEAYTLNEEEYSALGAHFEDPGHLVMPLFSAPILLHVLVSPDRFPSRGFAPIYITSKSVPGYVRLHLLARLLDELSDPALASSDEDLCMIAMRVLEDAWAVIEDNGPPDVSEVMKHMLPATTQPSFQTEKIIEKDVPTSAPSRRRRPGQARVDKRTDEEVKQEFEVLCRTSKYGEILEARKKLPAFAAKEDFLRKLQSSRVVVVVGETGSGKTTQLPQFILDSLIFSGSGSKASIIVTQPRRISAISVSQRVHYERTQDGSVGYAIRGESKYEPGKTKLLFCTTGVVLRRLSAGDTLKDVTHVVVDEVHERSVDCDFLLLELKELLNSHPTLKVVLMSATINYSIFSKYFNDAPLLKIPGFTHPVTDIYLENIVPLIGYRPQIGKQFKKGGDKEEEEFSEQPNLQENDIRAIQAVSRNDHIDYQLIAGLINHIIKHEAKSAILVFLPGTQEIRHCIEAIRASVPSGSADVFPLHANLSSDEQLRVFAPSKKWKIIAATNVAETSITIDDVVHVIDSGKVKENAYNPELGFSTLKETWVTKAAARQRRGRAGRTQPGKCFKLFTKKRESDMKEFPTPEMLRISLENVLLTVKVMREGEDVERYLNQAIDPPSTAAIKNAIDTLEDLGAIDSEGTLSSLGKHLSMLSVDLRLAKMLILGTIFRCLDPILSIVAMLSSKSLFLSPAEQREEANRARAKFVTGSSDLLTDVTAYNEVVGLRKAGKPQSQIKRYCEENFLSPTTVRDITTVRHELIATLADIGFVPLQVSPDDPSLNTNSNKTNVLKAIVAGGLWPRVARVYLPTSAIKFDKVQAGSVQRDNSAKEFRFYDLKGERAFLHPSSILFTVAAWKSPIVAFFQQHKTTKSFLRSVTEVPVYGALLFGGPVSINHIAGGVTIQSTVGHIKLKAWPRIGVLVNQLRQLLDVQLRRCMEDGATLDFDRDNPVALAIISLLENDGSTEF